MAADIRAEADGGERRPRRRRRPGPGVAGHRGQGRPRLRHAQGGGGRRGRQRQGRAAADPAGRLGIWLYPTGWCDVGYSAAEVVVKEVEEETGINVEPVRLIAVLDGLRLGFTRVPLYSLLFYCHAVGGELEAAPARDARCRMVHPRDLPSPLVGSERWGDHVFAALAASSATCSTTASASPCGGASRTRRDLRPDRRVGRRRPGGGGGRAHPAAVPLGASADPRAAGAHRGRPGHHAVRGRGRRADRRHADPGRLRDPHRAAGLDRGRRGRRGRPRQGRGQRTGQGRAGPCGRRSVPARSTSRRDPTARPPTASMCSSASSSAPRTSIATAPPATEPRPRSPLLIRRRGRRRAAGASVARTSG